MIIRPPKWLRQLIDFEIVLGEDLNPMCRAKRLYPYYKKLEYDESIKTRRNIVEDSSAQLVKKIENILNSIKEEYSDCPYKDKYKSYYKDYSKSKDYKLTAKCVDYTFENGDEAFFTILNEEDTEGEFIFEVAFKSLAGEYFATKSYGKRLYNITKNLLIKITNNSVKREINKNADEITALKNKYNLITKKIKLRQEEIDKTDKNSSTREALINELNSYKTMADKLKKQFCG